VSDQFADGPVVQRLAVRLEADQVVLGQLLQPIGQDAGEPPAATADDDHVEQLLLLGQIAFHFDHEGRAGEEVGQE
jgi:hypothetical protein